MSNVTDIRPFDIEAARELVNSIPPGKVKRKELVKDLPDILETALGLLLEEVDARRGQGTPGAVGCRIVAACISRLRG